MSVYEQYLGTEVPADWKSMRIRLMIHSGLQRTICFTPKGLGCIRVQSGKSEWKSQDMERTMRHHAGWKRNARKGLFATTASVIALAVPVVVVLLIASQLWVKSAAAQ